MNDEISSSKFRTLLSKLSSREDFIIFTYPKTENFIQFAWEDDGELIVDIPTKDINEKNPSIQQIKSEVYDLKDNGFNSLEKVCSIEEAINIINIFFEKICNLPKNYGLEVSLYSNNTDSEFFLGEKNNDKIDFLVCDYILKTINIVEAKNIKEAKEKYALLYLEVEDPIKYEVEMKNNESSFWEEFVYENRNNLLDNLEKTFEHATSQELFDFYNNSKLKFNDLSDKTKKEIALRELNIAVDDDTIVFKAYFQVNKL